MKIDASRALFCERALDSAVRYRVYNPLRDRMQVGNMAMNELATSDSRLGIGNLASLTGVSVETLRYYEQRGLVRPAGRKPSGYREYPQESVRLVRFIRRAQKLGFTLAEVEELVGLRTRAWSGDAGWKLREAAVAKVADFERRIRELTVLKGALSELVSACDQSCAMDKTRRGEMLPCPLIEAFDTADAADAADLTGASSTNTKRRKPK